MVMSKEQRIDDRVPTRSNRNRFACFEDEIVEKIIRPKLVEAIRQRQPRNKSELLEAFREVTGYENCTLHTLTEWMEKCGFKIERKMQITVEAPDPENEGLPDGVRELGSGAPRPSGGAPPQRTPMPAPRHGGLASPF